MQNNFLSRLLNNAQTSIVTEDQNEKAINKLIQDQRDKVNKEATINFLNRLITKGKEKIQIEDKKENELKSIELNLKRKQNMDISVNIL